METFFGPEDHDRYVLWLESNPQGYVLQHNQTTDLVLHRSNCNKIGAHRAPPPRGRIWTNYPKDCSNNLADFDNATRHCTRCNP